MSLMCLFARAFSRSSAVIRHSLRIDPLPLMKGKKSRSFRPRRICAGDRFMPCMGVFLYCIRARANLSVSRLPWDPTLSLMSLLAVFTANSALQFECGKATELTLCRMPQFLKNSCVISDMRVVPPSEANSTGAPNTINHSRNVDTNVDDVAVPLEKYFIDSQPE